MSALRRHSITMVEWIEEWIDYGTDLARFAAAYYEQLSPRAQSIIRDEVEYAEAEVREDGKSSAFLRPCREQSQWGFDCKIYRNPGIPMSIMLDGDPRRTWSF